MTPSLERGTDSPPGAPDAVTLEVFRHLFQALADEMGAALRRAAYSPNIKERRDYSCALFDDAVRPVAMGDHMPVHLGAMPMSVQAALEELGPLAEGDVAIVNDPFRGGTHLPDITAIRAVYAGDDVLGYVAARAHHSDVGGIAPGSMPLAREIVQEGLRIPPVRLVSAGTVRDDLRRLILANVRTPDERAGDLDAQLAALHTGHRRLSDMVRGRGEASVRAAMRDLIAYADRLLEAGLTRIPDGRWEGSDTLEDDGFGSGPIEIRVAIDIEGATARVDFTGSAAQVPGGVNAVAAITSSATRYVLRSVTERLLGIDMPAGGGSLRSVELVMPEGSIVNARPPASVAAGNVETSQRITDVLFRALTPALPDLLPALSQGTMNNTTVGGVDPRTGEPFAYYETVGGGQGGGPDGPGLSGVHVHMSNSLNTPIEALEHAYPFRITRYELRAGSGGAGRHPGGEGLRRDLQLLGDARVTLLTERRTTGPSGAAGGHDGAPGANVLIRHGVEKSLEGKVTFEARAGDVVSLRTPGGGGWGTP
ncbi:hydantoinase B/oxoprolinase family protein [Gaopeijia maritima]|uniref:Hydantoinase B/oxoprolinase family protein n=1 Tax=Gaopeijia maritima TaxID=3119007 RepID=A0ABU9EBC1_9BACT